MRWLLSLSLLALVSLAQALSSTGNRLLVVIEEAAEKTKYSQFWGDLEGKSSLQSSLFQFDEALLMRFYYLARGYKLTFESPKNEKLSLFLHGERNFDHILLLPPKSKGPSLQFLPYSTLFTDSQGLVPHLPLTSSFNSSTKMATSC